ncbi:amino acid adenylation domain-containing protein [Streptomyces sp. NBC_00047]|uniref:amino acid adenylation domain-containing protein n=1 Tax=Streptomyces sp. NBC_00047 TaxID=2975627 RepID=UPI0022502B1E|nr:amino acid adenylation domain-containing protein [Streptomyces sp. NBC_00047]MCX5612903.1 amino acid adenylation domain-containing protein [Streptomyces sp. NBC_00047]
MTTWRQTLETLNDTAAPVPDGPVAELLAARARPVADRPAVLARDRTLTHGELHGLAEALAVRLREHGAGPGVLVRVCLPRSAELVVAVLAVLRAGAAYVPLDPDHPAERLAQLVDGAPAPITLTTARLAHLLPPQGLMTVDLDELDALSPLVTPARSVPPPSGPAPGPADLAYVIHTSGSTGRPKGVAIEQRSLANLLEATAVPFGLGPDRRVLQFASPAFDVSVWEILAPLWAGAAVVVFDEPVASAEALAALVRERRADTVFLLAALLAQLDPAAFPDVRTVVTGGESFSRALVDRWAPGRDLIYVYGPTEATVFQSWHRCPPGVPGEPPTIGRPMANLRYFVRDASGAQVGPGVEGELWIGGIGVGRGYLGRPDAGAARFVPDPGDPRPGARLYRTGDLARHRPDGTLDFRGRADRQVKIRGFRIEPGEVETALAALPGIAAAAVVVPEGTAQPLLAGYVVTDGPLPADWRARLAQRLPYYMVPAAVIPVERMPSTPNGKIDRRELAARPLPDTPAGQPSGDAGGESGEEADEVRTVLRALFTEALGRPVADDGDFFLLGGTSLKAASLAAAAARRLSAPVRIRDVFDCPSVAALAARLAPRVGTDSGSGSDLPAGTAGAPQRASAVQRWLWLEDRSRGAGTAGTAAYHVPMLLDCHGAADPAALRAAFARLQELQPQLRTVFREERGEPVPGPAPEPARLEVLDLPDEPAREAVVREWSHRPFDLAAGPLVRAALLRRPGGRDRLLVVLHHIVADQTSLEVVARALAGAGGHAAEAAPELPVPGPHEQSYDMQLAYWRRQLTPASDPLPLPVDHPRTGPAGRGTAVTAVRLGPEELGALEELARGHRTGLFGVLAAAVAATLHEATGAADISLGTAVSRRPALGRADAVGCLVNTVVLRTAVHGELPCAELIADLADKTVGALDHGGLPFSELVGALDPPRRPGRNPLFDVWVTLWDEIDTGPGELRLTGGPIPLDEGLFDLSFQFARSPRGLSLLLQYDRALYEPGTARDLAEKAADAARRLTTAGPQARVYSLVPPAPAPQSPTGGPAFAGFSWGAPRP